ncbi:hypothetical protein C483_00869 [Natrialba hulunbeirensis JCM 10989]|uniref:HTH marR-type domain-containing protein n=2 Tax=Natrialba hulunbeirensis TaxID=123783 RepID=M0AE91_9EURY|nr:hypothetical protein C483_00869 [Natrialba hulunbeirensis JCM 10989]
MVFREPMCLHQLYSNTDDKSTVMTQNILVTSMPIDIETFNEHSDTELKGETNAERVITYLARNDDKAFTPSEIAAGAGVKKGSVSTVLSRLEDANLVRHKGEYWAIGDMDRVRDAYNFHKTVQRLNEQYGSEDPEEWKEHAVD